MLHSHHQISYVFIHFSEILYLDQLNIVHNITIVQIENVPKQIKRKRYKKGDFGDPYYAPI